MQSAATTNIKPRKTRTARQRWFLRVSYLFYVMLLLYGGCRLFFWIRYERNSSEPMADVDHVWRHHYEELWTENVLAAKPSLDDDRFDVLLLGGSVAEQVAEKLQAQFEAQTDQPVHVYSVARAAHSTRDSLNKFRRLSDKKFDAVIIYHGINEVSMSYIEDSKYKDDYSHCGWYRSFERRIKAGRMTISEISQDIFTTIGRAPEVENLAYGDNIKTGPAFHNNLTSITETAKRNGSTVVLMSFAWYIPANYSKARMRAKELDYVEGQYDMPVEKWGRVKDIPRMLKVHNVAARKVADEQQVLFVEQSKLLGGSDNFCDVCHLSPAGCLNFARNTVAELVQANAFPKK